MKLSAGLLASFLLGVDLAAAADEAVDAPQQGLRGNGKLAPQYDLRQLQSKGGNPFDEDKLTGEVIVSRKSPKKLKKEGKTEKQIKELREKGLKKIKQKDVVKESKRKNPDDGDFHVVKVGKGNEAAYIHELMNGDDGDLFAFAEPNLMHDIVVTPNDPNINSQWHHVNMESRAAWDLEQGSAAVTVAICDTGLDLDHPDLTANALEGYHAPTQTWQSNGGPVADVHPHGTNCAGCAATIGNNGVGIAGVGWNFHHRPGRVTDSSGGSASSADLADCAERMCELPDVKVSSVSYSGVEGALRRSAATYCKTQGALMVNAAGNDSRDLTQFGNHDADDLIVAAASDSNDNKASFSAYGAFVDVWAPGVSVYTTTTGGGYTSVSGTSFSCPLTAGLIALIWSKNPELTPDQVETILKQSSELTGIGNLSNYGTSFGRINSKRAMEAAGSGTPFPTMAPTTPPPTTAPTTAAPTLAPIPQQPGIEAQWDGTCARCTAVGGSCTSAALFDGRGSLGPEPNFPNTMDACNDGISGAYHSDESCDAIEVEALGGGYLQVGRVAVIKATVWAWSTGSSDTADFYYSNTDTNPSWIHISSKVPPAGGVQVLTSEPFVLTSTNMAVRVNFRFNGSTNPCSGGSYDDADDLAFAVLPAVTGPPVTNSPTNAPTNAPTDPPVTSAPTALPKDGYCSDGTGRCSANDMSDCTCSARRMLEFVAADNRPAALKGTKTKPAGKDVRRKLPKKTPAPVAPPTTSAPTPSPVTDAPTTPVPCTCEATATPTPAPTNNPTDLVCKTKMANCVDGVDVCCDNLTCQNGNNGWKCKNP